MDPTIDVYTPCLVDDLDVCLEDNTLFTDQPNQVIKCVSLSESDFSMSAAGSDQVFGDVSSETSFSPNHSLISEEDDIDLLRFLVKDNDIKTASVAKITKQDATSASVKSNPDNGNASIAERNRKNAIAAKENRQKKKKYVEGLEAENQALSADNEKLKRESGELKRKVESLEEEVLYLKSVLAHQSTLSNLLKNIGTSDVKLTTSFETRTSEPRSKRRRTVNSATTGGVCLHVANDTVSLEFCSKCAGMAKGQDRK